METLQLIAGQGSLWDDTRSYKLGEIPVYFVRRDDEDVPVKAYLVNYPRLPKGAQEVRHSYAGVGPVYRYDSEMNEFLSSHRIYFGLDISGRTTFAIAYTPKNMDYTPLETIIPYTSHDIWTDIFVHECFHHYQFYCPDSDWIKTPWGGGSTEDYPMTVNNIALSLLEKHVLLEGSNASSITEKRKALLRLLAIRFVRVALPEATVTYPFHIAVRPKIFIQSNDAPNGIGQSFLAYTTGIIKSIKVDIYRVDNPCVRLELWDETHTELKKQIQIDYLRTGENTFNLSVPIETGVIYSFRLFPQEGFLELWSSRGSYPGGEAFFIINSKITGIRPSSDLVFEINQEQNFIDCMDRYQERIEGSAVHVSRRFFKLSGNTVYSQEMHEQLERIIRDVGRYETRNQIFKTFFQGGWYATGSTIIDLLDEVYGTNYRVSFPAGGSPIKALESYCGPLSREEIEQLIADAKEAYNWPGIMEQVFLLAAAAGL